MSFTLHRLRAAVGCSVLAAGVVLGSPGVASALDTIYLRDNSQKKGNVTAESPTGVEVTTGAGSIKKEETIPANDIVRISFDGEPPALNLRRGDELQGKLDEALAGYQESLPMVPDDKPIQKADLEFLIARVTAKLAKADPAKLADAIAKLEAFRTAHPNSFRYFQALSLLGEMYLLNSDYAKAGTVFAEVEKAPWPDYQMAAKISQGRLLLRQNKAAEAQAQFQTVADQNVSTDAEKARRYEAMLGVATALQRQNQADQAAKMLEQVIQEAPADDTKTMAEAYLRKGDTLLAAGKKKDALLAYLHVDVLFSSEKDLHAEALYRLASLWNEVGKPDRAADASAQLSTLYANSEWAKQLSTGG